MLCTLTEIKLHLALSATDTEHDGLLTIFARGVSVAAARLAGRIVGHQPALERAAWIRDFSVEPRCSSLWLPSYPVVEVTEIKEAVYKTFDDSDALVEDTDYMLDAATGELVRIGTWLAGDFCVRVSWTGGYTACAEWESGETYAVDDRAAYEEAIYRCKSAIDPSATAPPDDTDHWEAKATEVWLARDIHAAAVKQVAYYFQRKADLGLIGAGVQGASFSRYAEDNLLPDVRECFASYGRAIG